MRTNPTPSNRPKRQNVQNVSILSKECLHIRQATEWSGRTAFDPVLKVRLPWRRSTDMIRPGKLPLNAVHRSAICTSSDASHGVTPSSCCSKARSVALSVPAFALYLLQVLAQGHCSFAVQLCRAASPCGFTTRPAAIPGSRPRNTRCSSSWRSHRI